MRRLIKSIQVEIALQEIYFYTADHWGITQADRYHDQFEIAFNLIVDRPELGHLHIDVQEPYRVYAVGSHFIVYRSDARTVNVIGIFHQSMSIGTHLKPLLQKDHLH